MRSRPLIRCLFALACAALAGAASVPTWPADDPPPALFSRTIVLVRHGAYDIHSFRELSDGPGLTPLGIAQSRLVAARLRGFSAVATELISSTMLRARETADVIHESLRSVPVKRSDLLRECTPPVRPDAKGGQRADQQACQTLLDQAFERYFMPARGMEARDILVCHGNVIRYFVTRALQVDTRSWGRMDVPHASLTVIRVRPNGTMSVLSVGDIGHIPPNMQSFGNDADPQLIAPAAQ